MSEQAKLNVDHVEDFKIEILKKEIWLEALVESKTAPGAYYKMRLSDDDWSCSCAAFEHNPNVYCKHIRATQRFL